MRVLRDGTGKVNVQLDERQAQAVAALVAMLDYKDAQRLGLHDPVRLHPEWAFANAENVRTGIVTMKGID